MKKSSEAARLRQKAEKLLEDSRGNTSGCSTSNQAEVFHELQVHQMELEIQNEELRRIQNELQESRNRYHDLYEYAPIGYLTLNNNYKITGINLTGSQLLNIERSHIQDSLFTRYIGREETDRFYLYFKQAFTSDSKMTLELKMQRADKTPFFARLESLRTGPFELRLALIDITDRKCAEDALIKAKDELEIKVKERTEQLQEAYDEIMQSQNDLKEANKQLKQYASKIIRIQEEERKRIAYELHDDTAQYLSILKMQIGALAESEEIQNPRVKEKLKFLEKDANRAFNDVRRYSHELRPTTLEHQGLVGALVQVADDYNILGQLEVEVHIEGAEPELSEDVKLGFFRIAQEALNNSRKHAKASRVDINVRFNHKQIRMMISDNGAGFDIEQTLKKRGGQSGLGLLSMRERADLINANLKIVSAPGKGTEVILTTHI